MVFYLVHWTLARYLFLTYACHDEEQGLGVIFKKSMMVALQKSIKIK